MRFLTWLVLSDKVNINDCNDGNYLSSYILLYCLCFAEFWLVIFTSY